MRARPPSLENAPFPGHPCQAPLRFDRTRFTSANRFRGVKRPCPARRPASRPAASRPRRSSGPTATSSTSEATSSSRWTSGGRPRPTPIGRPTPDPARYACPLVASGWPLPPGRRGPPYRRARTDAAPHASSKRLRDRGLPNLHSQSTGPNIARSHVLAFIDRSDGYRLERRLPGGIRRNGAFARRTAISGGEGAVALSAAPAPNNGDSGFRAPSRGDAQATASASSSSA